MEASQTIIINRIITTALKRRATDLHLTVGNNPVLRLGGKLEVLADEEIITADFLNNLAQSLFSKEEMDELSQQKEIAIVHNYGNQVRFRINVFFQKKFLNFSFRFISPIIPPLKDLGLPRVIQNLVNLKKGLIIIGGGYDSGRTTSVFALLDEINKTQRRYILTIEKPVEFLLTSNRSIVVQRNIPSDAADYLSALKYCDKEDIDIVMIDHIGTDADVLMKILELASSGKLIISIMEAENAVDVIGKMLSNFVDKDRERVRLLLANVLECILIQKLVPRIGGGRIIAPEILLGSDPVKAIIREDRIYQLNNILQTSREEGMRGIDKSLAELVSVGEISIDEALDYANNKESFKIMMR